MNFIREFKNYIYWNLISKHQKLSESFIKEFIDDLEMRSILQYQTLSEEFIIYMLNNPCINPLITSYMNTLIRYQKLSTKFITDYIDKSYIKTNIHIIFENQKLTNEFIVEHITDENKYTVFHYQSLSEELITQFIKLTYICCEDDWDYISEYQKLSESFVRKYQNQLDLREVFVNNKYSQAFIDEMRDTLLWLNIPIPAAA